MIDGNTVDVARLLVERIAVRYPKPAMFSADEFSLWPLEFVDRLHVQGVLSQSTPAQELRCEGCHRLCVKPVQIRARHSDGKLYGRMWCDEDAQLGPIRVSTVRLKQYETSLWAFAEFVRASLKMSAGIVQDGEHRLRVGTIKGRYGSRSVALEVEDRDLIVRVGLAAETTTRIVHAGRAGLTVDLDQLKRMANRKAPPASDRTRYLPGKAVQQSLARQTAARDKQIYRVAISLHNSSGLSWTDAANEITVTEFAVRPDGKRLSAGRVRKIISVQRALARKYSRAKHARPTD